MRCTNLLHDITISNQLLFLYLNKKQGSFFVFAIGLQIDK